MTKAVKFKDFKFKLAVIEVLMYRKKLLQPEFNVREFVKTKPKKFDIEMKGYQPVPGATKFFRDLEIPAELLGEVEILDQNYRSVYHNIIPYWDGEGDEFNITSTEDVKLLPNLKEVILFYDREQKMVNAFKAKGIEARYM